MIAQLYVVNRWMLCCASLLPDCLQGSQYLLSYLGPSLLLDSVKVVGQPLGGKAWGQCLSLTLAAPSPYPSAQVLVQSLKWSPTPATTHTVSFVPGALMSLSPVWAQFHQSVHVAPLVVHVPIATYSLVCAAPVLPWVSASTHATPSISLSTFAWSSCHTVTS